MDKNQTRNEREDDHERIGKKRTRRKDEKRERRREEVELKS